ncbi:MAG: hypothetical protein Q8N79_07100, partial [Candidatus Methanoperedens sp.]|nr:hypothetical protein [Candidatus Methanoperedens sp.]
WKSWRETCALNKSHPEAATLFNPEKLPAFHDPFAGGGAIPLEAQRLGLESYASDLNPVAVLINKAMIEIPPKFAGRAPVGPLPPATNKKNATHNAFEDWSGAKGLAEDVRRYGYWMREEAFKRIGHFYPEIEITADMAKERPDLEGFVGQKLTVIAWLWARTVKCPNPACGCQMPLISSFVLSSKKGKEAYLIPTIINGDLHIGVSLKKPSNIDVSEIKKGFKRGTSGIFECVNCGTVTSRNYTSEQAKSIGLGSVQTAIVCKGGNGRIYLPVNFGKAPVDIPEVDKTGLQIEMSPNPRDVWCRNFGLNTPSDLFTPRQLMALTTFSDLVQEAQVKVKIDTLIAGMIDNDQGLNTGGIGATAYADAVAVYLACALGKIANIGSTIASWMSDRGAFRETFARQAIPMTWDYAEANPFADAGGSFATAIDKGVMAISSLPANLKGQVFQANASLQSISQSKVISTDPPYYDNISYADLSDFFYVWLRRTLRPVYPGLFATMAVPKAEELIATTYRHGSKKKAEKFFLDGMTEAMHRLAEQAHPAFPVTIYYAFKQGDTTDIGTGNTGWETFLEAVIRAGFVLTGTWPMRTEGSGRLIAKDTNALASSIILVCRQRETNATTLSRREFLR